MSKLSLLVLAVAAAFTLAAPAFAAPPAVSDLSVSTRELQATVAFTTSADAVVWAEYGLDEPVVWTNASRGTSHTLTLTGLYPSTDYKLRLHARALHEEETSVVETTFKTAPIPFHTEASYQGRNILLNGQPFFPIMHWDPCPKHFDLMLSLNINTLMGGCNGYGPKDILGRLAGRGYYIGSIYDRSYTGPGMIGWHQPDEPEGNGALPEHLPDLPGFKNTGRLTFQTFTTHFAKNAAPISDRVGKDLYPLYAAKSEVLGFDIYPLAKYCFNDYTGIVDVFDAQVDLLELAQGPERPTYQWLETGPSDQECIHLPETHTVTPEAVRVETYLALAGGTSGIGWFTHSFEGHTHNTFDVKPDVQEAMRQVNREVMELAPALLDHRKPLERIFGTKVRVGVRKHAGATYVIAGNPTLTEQKVGFKVPGLGSRELRVYREGRTQRSYNDFITDTFAPREAHVYVLAPDFTDLAKARKAVKPNKKNKKAGKAKAKKTKKTKKTQRTGR